MRSAELPRAAVFRTFAVASLLAIGLLVAGCSSQVRGHGSYAGHIPGSRIMVFDAQKMARDIERSEQGRSLGTVVCPVDEVIQKGRKFDCHAGNDITIHIVITSDSGDYTWQPEQSR